MPLTLVDHRLQNIEASLSQITEAIQTLAKVEERMQVQQAITQDHEERLRVLERTSDQRASLVGRFLTLEADTSKRLGDMEKTVEARGVTISAWSKVGWAIAAAAIAAAAGTLWPKADAKAIPAQPIAIVQSDPRKPHVIIPLG